MSVPAKLMAFAAVLVVVFAGAFAVGTALGPIDLPDRPATHGSVPPDNSPHDGGSHPGGGR